MTKQENNTTAAASTNATSVTTSVTELQGVELTNEAAYNVFFKIYDKASAPTVGTDAPVITIPVAANAEVSRQWADGLLLNNGYAFAMTKNEADSDTTVLVAGDLKAHSDYLN